MNAATCRRWIACWLGSFGIGAGLSVQAQPPSAGGPRTIFLVGDSTVRNGSDSGAGRLWGWGHFLGERIDPAAFKVANRALGGRSSRTYRTEGLWTKVLDQLQPGDLVLIQFGHNDGGPVDSGRGRASLKGVGAATQDVHPPDKPAETVHTYGWYLRQYVTEAKGKGAIPIVLSPVPRDIWTPDGHVVRAARDYGGWAGEVARAENALFVDLNDLVATRYEAEGRDQVERAYFTPQDHTHTTEAGARVNSACVVAGLRQLKDDPVSLAWLPDQ